MDTILNTLNVQISGMDCSECAEHVDRAIRSVPNVHDVQVFLGAEKAKIIYQDSVPDFQLIRQAVKEAGYEAFLKTRPELDESKNSIEKAISRHLLMIFGIVIGVVLFVAVIGEWFGLFKQLDELIHWYVWLMLILAGGWPIFRIVVRFALKGQVISHTLMTLGVIAAASVKEWPTAAVVVMFMRIGDYVEGLTTGKARKAVKDLTSLAPQSARVEYENKEEIVPITQVKIGDIVVIHPGEAISVDGTVKSGAASIDQSAISGESMPIDVFPGSRVFAASIIQTGYLKIKAAAVGSDTTFGKVIQLVEEAEGNRADVQRIADKFAGYYLPIVAVIALLTLLIRRDPLAAAATLVVACSCSFALATPIAMLASIGSAARKGLLIKGGKYLETLARIDTLFVDKTGTLTTGKLEITDIHTLGDLEKTRLIQLTVSVEQHSEHPLGEAVRANASQAGITPLEAKDFKNMPGIGVRGMVGDALVEVLNDFKSKENVADDLIKKYSSMGKTTFFIVIDGKLAGVMAASDTPRAEVKDSIRLLRGMGINQIVLLSGDKETPVKQLAEDLGIEYHAGLLPEEKISFIRESQVKGKRVAMVGDGINDAPALAQADVGIAMGAAGSEIAIQAAHIALMREDWMLVPQVFKIARRTMGVVKSNILFTAFYNLAGLSLAAFGILPPIFAAALQSLPDVGILANSARLIRK